MCKTEAKSVALKQQDDKLYVEMDLLIDCDRVSDDSSHMITPVLCYNDKHMELPLMLVAGRCRYRSLRWSLWGLGKNTFRPYRIRWIFNAFGCSLIHHRYRVRVSYEPWMQRANIRFM